MAAYYDDRYLEISQNRFQSSKEISNELISNLRRQENKSTNNKHILLGLIIVLSISVISVFIYYKVKSRKEKLKFDNVISAIAAKVKNLEDNPIFSTDENLNKQISIGSNNLDSIMPIETEKRLLEGLRDLEKKEFYLQKNISLSSVASELNSNQKYISNVINNHKNKDFSNYINELRILYIISKFQSNPTYLKYKLAFIADECGFSSHSKFTAEFKNHTGIPPSVFIRQLRRKS